MKRHVLCQIKRIALVLAFLFCAVPGWAAVVPVDSATTGQTPFGMNATSLTFSFTVGSCTNCVLYVGCDVVAASVTITGVTFDGVAMASGGTPVRGNTTQYVSLWQLAGPHTGTHDVIVTADGSVAMQCGAADFSGGDQTTPTSGYTTQIKSFANISQAITCGTDDLAVDLVMYSGGGNPGPGMGQTILWNTLPQNFGWGASYQGGIDPTMTWDTSTLVSTWAGMCIKASTPPPTSNGGCLLLGVC